MALQASAAQLPAFQQPQPRVPAFLNKLHAYAPSRPPPALPLRSLR
jgi:hypothetical protein